MHLYRIANEVCFCILEIGRYVDPYGVFLYLNWYGLYMDFEVSINVLFYVCIWLLASVLLLYAHTDYLYLNKQE